MLDGGTDDVIDDEADADIADPFLACDVIRFESLLLLSDDDILLVDMDDDCDDSLVVATILDDDSNEVALESN